MSEIRSETARAAAPGGVAAGGPRPGLALLVLAAAQLMVVLDATIVNVALPHIQRALGFSGLQLGSLLPGIWLIISPPILDHKHPIAHAMYRSNSFSGGVLIALAAAGLGFAALRRTAR
jgi:hypothetical protein